MPNEPKNYDFVIIGGGPAGIYAALELGEHGKSVALINDSLSLGGAGVNTGTIPSKTLRETALALSGVRSRNLYGVDLSVRRDITVSDFLGHEQHVRGAFNNAIAHRVEAKKIDVHVGSAAFTDPHTLEVTPIPDGPQETKTVRGGTIILATGSSPNRPDLFFSQKGEIYDSDTVLNLDRIPKTMAVVGSGVIGSEYSCIFAALGAKVHLVDGHDGLMPFLDAEVIDTLGQAMNKNGITFHWKQMVTKCEPIENDGVKLTLSGEEPLSVGALLVAAGRHSNTEALNLPAAGVKTDAKGTVLVDDCYCTNVPHIFSAGDIIGYPALASTSMAQGRLAARHALGLQDPGIAPVLPTGIYTIPEISVAGESEASAQKKNIPVVVGKANYSDNARGRIIGDLDGFLKLVFRKDDMQLIGVHVIGEQATEIVHIGLLGILTNIKAELLVDICFNTPTLSMCYKMAALDAIRKAGAPKGMTRLDRSALALAVSLSALAGYVDSLGFLQLGGYFVSFMSGNSTQAGVDTIKGGPLLPLLLIAGFVTGVIAGSLIGGKAGKQRRPILLGIVTLLLIGAAGAHRAALDSVAIAAMVLAMGAENTIFEEDGDVRFGLTYVTGSLVKMGQKIAAAFKGGRRGDWLPYLLLWAGLFGGAIAGAASYLRWGLDSLWIAGGTAALLTFVARAVTPNN